MPNLEQMPDDAEQTDGGSLIRRSDGRVLFFSIVRFKKDIAEGDCCFICGARRGSKIFNDEHVIPSWILRRYDMHDRKMRLPNGIETTYGNGSVANTVLFGSATIQHTIDIASSASESAPG